MTTVRAFSIISPAIDYWPLSPLDATRVDETKILAGSISNGFRPVPFRARKQQFAREGRGTQEIQKFMLKKTGILALVFLLAQHRNKLLGMVVDVCTSS